jgi:DNA polymerase III delta prime subunit
VKEVKKLLENTLWFEKYRPKQIKDCILSDKMMKTFKGFIKSKDVPNLMLTGSQGTGKTTLGKVIAKELGAELLYIDCSTDNGKAMIQEMIVPYASTISIDNPDVPKFILCDECDYLSASAMASLRPILERYSLTTRFIFTGNYAERIIPALKSRCACFDFSITKEDKPQLMTNFFKRCEYILQDNNVEYDKKVLMTFISKVFPDFRRTINELQSYSIGRGVIDEGILTIGLSNTIADEVYPLLKEHKFESARKWVAESVNSPEDVFASLYNRMADYVPQEQQPELILVLAQYQDYATRVANQNINLMACFTECMNVL